MNTQILTFITGDHDTTGPVSFAQLEQYAALIELAIRPEQKDADAKAQAEAGKADADELVKQDKEKSKEA